MQSTPFQQLVGLPPIQISRIVPKDFVVGYGPIKYYSLAAGAVPPSLILKLRPDKVFWVEIKGPKPTMPHRDHGVSCNLNFYVKTGGVKTWYWKVPPGVTGRRYLKTDQKDYFYAVDDLEPWCDFTANDGETYLLNVDEVHSVQQPESGEYDRSFVQFAWANDSFDEVLNRCTSAWPA